MKNIPNCVVMHAFYLHFKSSTLLEKKDEMKSSQVCLNFILLFPDCITLLLVFPFQALANAFLRTNTLAEAGAWGTPVAGTCKGGAKDQIVETLLGGLARWDSEYFIHIATFGYDLERLIAFFPGWPWLLSAASSLLEMGGHLNSRSAILVAGALLNVVLSTAAADALYRLTRAVAGKELAYYAAVMFCATPATIAFSALYSEPLYTWATFEALYHLYKYIPPGS